MLDTQFIRDNKDVLRFSLERRGAVVDLDAIEKIDDARKTAGQDKAQLETILPEWRSLMLTVPNLLDISVPSGKKDELMCEIRGAGTPARAHSDMAQLHAKYGVLTIVRDGATVTRKYSGMSAQIYENLRQAVLTFLKPQVFQYSRAQFGVSKESLVAAQLFNEANHSLMPLAPFGYLPSDAHVYALETVANSQAEIAQLPTYTLVEGTTVEHEAERFTIGNSFGIAAVCEPTHQASVTLHETLTASIEAFLVRLAIPYKTSVRTALYTPVYAVKSCHIAFLYTDMTVPFADTAYMHDYLSRRLGVKVKTADGKPRFAHMACATTLSLDTIFDAFITSHEDALASSAALLEVPVL